MKPDDYLKYYGIKLKPIEKKLVLKAMEDYKNQTQLLFEVESFDETFVQKWNSTNKENGLKGRIRILAPKASRQLKALITAGYKVSEIIEAYRNALTDEYHKSTNFRYLTPEFMTRIDKFNKFINGAGQQNNDEGDYEYSYKRRTSLS